MIAPEKTQTAKSKTIRSEERNAGAVVTVPKSSLAALGVVFGDIATSPIYAVRECFHGEYSIDVSRANVMGVLSLMFWALVLIVCLKYMIFVFRAENRGEGGVLALTALIRGQGTSFSGRGVFISLGLFAACLLYGDGMITPAISVLSAVEGVGIITPVFGPYIIPLTIAILFGLFLIQRHGTARVGSLFGPVILIWLSFLAATGAAQIFRTPEVLKAVFPWYAFRFFMLNKLHGFVVLGAVFLVVTGTEALYADMGHFGTRPIRLTWFTLVFPALALNYFGQGAFLLIQPEAASHPFYSIVPPWAMAPAVLLSTLATIIASQAVISGAFSLTRQAIQLGYLPRLNIRHTSTVQIGQIYVAPVNWMLMVCTIALVIGFQSSSKLAAAYGVAVTSTMLITTMLFFIVAHRRWNWTLGWAVVLAGLFFMVEVPFFLANISKIFHGAWFPLVVAGFFFTMMLTWTRGRRMLSEQLRRIMPPIHQFIPDLNSRPLHKIEGEAVFLTGHLYAAPTALTKNVRHNRVIHSQTVLLHFQVEDVPRIPNLEKIRTEKLGGRFYLLNVRFGYMEYPHLKSIFALAAAQDLNLDLEKTSFYIGRENLVVAAKSKMARWRASLFIFMSRNAADAASFFDLPADQVIEVGVKLEI
jgi:KUP system potassium uptake protein